MLMWLLGGLGIAVAFAVVIIRNAEADDRQRKTKKRPATQNTWGKDD